MPDNSFPSALQTNAVINDDANGQVVTIKTVDGATTINFDFTKDALGGSNFQINLNDGSPPPGVTKQFELNQQGLSLSYNGGGILIGWDGRLNGIDPGSFLTRVGVPPITTFAGQIGQWAIDDTFVYFYSGIGGNAWGRIPMDFGF